MILFFRYNPPIRTSRNLLPSINLLNFSVGLRPHGWDSAPAYHHFNDKKYSKRDRVVLIYQDKDRWIQFEVPPSHEIKHLVLVRPGDWILWDTSTHFFYKDLQYLEQIKP